MSDIGIFISIVGCLIFMMVLIKIQDHYNKELKKALIERNTYKEKSRFYYREYRLLKEEMEKNGKDN